MLNKVNSVIIASMYSKFKSYTLLLISTVVTIAVLIKFTPFVRKED